VCPLGTWSFRTRLGGNHAHTRAGRRRAGLGFPTRSGSFWTGSHGYGLQRIVHAPPSGSEPNQRNGWQKNAANSWAVSVWNEPLQRFRPNRCNRSVRFGRIYPSRSAINSAPFLSNKTQQIQQNTQKRKRKASFFLCILKWDFQLEVWILQLGFWSDFHQIRSERRLRKFNRFFNRIVVWICDFRRRIFFYLPPFSTVSVPPK